MGTTCKVVDPAFLDVAVVFLGEYVQLRHHLVVLLFVWKDKLFEQFVVNAPVLFGLEVKDTFEHERIVAHRELKEV